MKAWPPTLRDSDSQLLLTDTVFIGEDDNSGGGSEAGLDASTDVHPRSHWDHAASRNRACDVKLTINADGSQGADVKHKVFWFQRLRSYAHAHPDADGYYRLRR